MLAAIAELSDAAPRPRFKSYAESERKPKERV
jgi:hypothetical protein